MKKSKKRSRNKPSSTLIGKDSIHWSFSKSRRFTQIYGQTNGFVRLKSNWGSGRAPSFGYGKRSVLMNATGASDTFYDLPSSFIITKGPKFHPSKTPKYVSTTPGPGNYKVNSSLNKGLAYSMKGRNKTESRRSKTPCPGSYDPSFRLVEKSQYSNISIKGKTKDRKGESTPGPGTYQVSEIPPKLSPFKDPLSRRNSVDNYQMERPRLFRPSALRANSQFAQRVEEEIGSYTLKGKKEILLPSRGGQRYYSPRPRPPYLYKDLPSPLESPKIKLRPESSGNRYLVTLPDFGKEILQTNNFPRRFNQRLAMKRKRILSVANDELGIKSVFEQGRKTPAARRPLVAALYYMERKQPSGIMDIKTIVDK